MYFIHSVGGLLIGQIRGCNHLAQIKAEVATRKKSEKGVAKDSGGSPGRGWNALNLLSVPAHAIYDELAVFIPEMPHASDRVLWKQPSNPDSSAP